MLRRPSLAVLLLALGCGVEPPGEDLLVSLPHAEVRREDADLLFSERVGRRGWGLVERDAAGAFRWAVDGEAAIEFYSLAAAATTLVGRARGALAPGLARQPTRVLLNGSPVADLPGLRRRTLPAASDPRARAAGGQAVSLQ